MTPEDGRIELQRVLVPIDHEPDPRAAIAQVVRAAPMATAPITSTLRMSLGLMPVRGSNFS